ncbi:MAG TPA: carboxymuconolactone decarboxylase family protein, partial [Aquaticitalea sp.]|nr:carboxymuconolactone decarboxylase family protein [Aquaticitalea sp.]
LGIATLVGGTIVIPHLRRAYEFWEALESGR